MNKLARWALAGAMAMAARGSMAQTADQGAERHRPRMFKRFGDHVNVPDGLAQDRHGNLYVSAPNFKDKSYPGTIMKMDRRTGKWSVFVPALLHPDTGRGGPMGMEFCQDGHLYYADNQYFDDTNYKSRILRVVIDRNGEPLRIEPVVENIKLANAVRIRGNAVYFTDTFFDLEGQNQGGIYRVPMSAFQDRPVRLLPKAQAANDPYCIGITVTRPQAHRNNCPSATDGMCFDRDGNIYTGNFGDGRFYVLTRRPDGTYEKPRLLVDNPKIMPCVDGVCYWPERRWVIIADSERNAIRYWDIEKGALGLLWENDDTDGADGLLDQPCEVMVWNGKLIIVNFDITFPGLKNTRNDEVHHLSVIDLDGPSFWRRLRFW